MAITTAPLQPESSLNERITMMMMMIGDPLPSKPTVHIPPWDYLEDPTVHIHSPSHHDASLAALQRFLPSNKPEGVVQEGDDEIFDSDFDFPGDAFSCDDFRMFDFKVRMCTRARSHDWTECPFAHPGEKARRRDPRRYHYSGSACPDFRRGACGRGDACEHAHGVFECWLHPSRYRTQPCKDGIHCRRRVCFFAHTPEQLRVFPHTFSPGGSPRPTETESFILLGSSPNPPLFISPPSSPAAVTPPASPAQSLKLNHLTESMRGMQISKLKMGVNLGSSPTPSWGLQFGSPRCPTIRPGFTSLPSTPIRAMTLSSLSPLDAWGTSCEEEPAMERVESGKALREKIYEKIGQENSLDWVHRDESASGGPDFGWVSELVM